jgi:hypothetical protein
LPSAHSRFYHLNEIAHCPQAVCDASGHRWSAPNRAIYFYEIVIAVMKRDGGFEVFNLLRESIRESRQATAVHSQSVILFFNVTCGNQIDNRTSPELPPQPSN